MIKKFKIYFISVFITGMSIGLFNHLWYLSLTIGKFFKICLAIKCNGFQTVIEYYAVDNFRLQQLFL